MKRSCPKGCGGTDEARTKFAQLMLIAALLVA
jgi:hypothetical protein